MDIREWQSTLNKAFSTVRPRGVRFQFFTDFKDKSIELWREGGKKPAGAKEETHGADTWYGFTMVADHPVTREQAESHLRALFTGFGV